VIVPLSLCTLAVLRRPQLIGARYRNHGSQIGASNFVQIRHKALSIRSILSALDFERSTQSRTLGESDRFCRSAPVEIIGAGTVTFCMRDTRCFQPSEHRPSRVRTLIGEDRAEQRIPPHSSQ
jgi:hypothetical protein